LSLLSPDEVVTSNSLSPAVRDLLANIARYFAVFAIEHVFEYVKCEARYNPPI
jgi:hypothetical protein